MKRVKCPYCKKNYDVREHKLGAMFSCRKCGKKFELREKLEQVKQPTRIITDGAILKAQKRKKNHLQAIAVLCVFTLPFGLLLWDTGGSDDQNSTNSPSWSQSDLPLRPTASNQRTAKSIPRDVTYRIFENNSYPGKLRLNIRLNRKVSEDVLYLIAHELKNSDPNDSKRAFIFYYPPGMQVGAGAWATTHFNPNLDVRILGLTSEDEETLRKRPSDSARKVIGSWLDERPFVGHRITFFRQGDKPFMERAFADGSASKEEIIKKHSLTGMKYEEKGENEFGDFYLINSQGDLEIWDKEGWISTANKVN